MNDPWQEAGAHAPLLLVRQERWEGPERTRYRCKVCNKMLLWHGDSVTTIKRWAENHRHEGVQMRLRFPGPKLA